VAAVLNLEIGAGAVAGGVQDRGRQDIAGFEYIAGQNLAVIRLRATDHFGDLRLMRISHHPFHAGHGGQFFGGALGIAAGYENARAGVFTMHAADGGAGIAIRLGRDGAGVEHNDIGLVAGFGFRETALGKLRFDGRAIGLSRTAAEILNVKAGHSCAGPVPTAINLF